MAIITLVEVALITEEEVDLITEAGVVLITEGRWPCSPSVGGADHRVEVAMTTEWRWP